jgi:type I restriction enzyme M protein
MEIEMANTAEIGFEKEIWDAACVLRGNMDASEYKNVILGLIFLKYISDSFDEKYTALVEEGEGFEEDRDEYDAENIFYVPVGARWKDIAEAAHKPEIGTVIDKAMAAIEDENKKLKGILPKNFARPELDKRRLGDVVDLFTNVQMADGTDEKDLLGRTYEYCLRNFAEQEGKNAGQFYTPSCVVRTIVEILQPYNGRVYDPCCGAGGMFVQSASFVKNHQGNINNISVYGQESNPTTWKMAKMNLAIRGIDCNLGEIPEDTFLNDQHPTMRADYVMANPPFNLTPWGADKLKEDQRWKYGMPPAGNANYAWIQHMIWHLAPNGRMGMVLANGSLSTQTGGEGEIRKNIIEEDLVECIISLPDKLFYTTGIPVCLWFITKNKKQKGKTLFIDARNMGTMVTRALRELSDGSVNPEDNDIKKLADTYNAFADGILEDEQGFCAVVDTKTIKAQDYILTPGRYVGVAEQEDDGEPFEEKMTRLTTELDALFNESHELEIEIRQKLTAIGYKM